MKRPSVSNQADEWSKAAEIYEREFIDPYREAVRSPLHTLLNRVLEPAKKTVADLGCGLGPLLPFLAKRFGKVIAIDFAEGMLARARERCVGMANVEFQKRSLTELGSLAGSLDVATAINSIVMPGVDEQEKVLVQIRRSLRPEGVFMGILPAMDAVHYYTMLLVDRAMESGKPIELARKNAAHNNDHECYDFAFGQFRFQGIEQHFWQPFEIRYRFRRAGFGSVRLRRVWLDWQQFSCAKELTGYRPPWDWFFHAKVSKVSAKGKRERQ
jgi:SAM-dependent methyltransferase